MGKYDWNGQYVSKEFEEAGEKYFEQKYNKMNVIDIDVTEAMGKKIDPHSKVVTKG